MIKGFETLLHAFGCDMCMQVKSLDDLGKCLNTKVYMYLVKFIPLEPSLMVLSQIIQLEDRVSFTHMLACLIYVLMWASFLALA